MDFKELFKPDRKKITLTIVLFLLCLFGIGYFPFNAFYTTGGGCQEFNEGMICIGTGIGINRYLLILNIIVRLITTYTFSSFIVWIYGKFKKKVQ